MEQRPDILALQELRDFRRDQRMRRFAAAVGMRAYLARECCGQPVAVLVRPPGQVAKVAPLRRLFHHAVARVIVTTTDGPLSVLSAHLDPYRAGRRRLEAGWVAGACGGDPDRMVLLMGDLNSLDPWSDHTERVGRLPAVYRSRHLRRGMSEVDTRAISVLDRAGLVDLFRHVGVGEQHTVPTTAGGGVEFTGMRLDYLFASPRLAERVQWCRVLRGGATESASDHYPLLAEINLSFQ